MKSQIEVNQLTAHININVLNNQKEERILSEGQLPVIDVPYKLEFVNIGMDEGTGNGIPEKWTLQFVGEVLSPEWKVIVKPEVFARVKWHQRIIQWQKELPFELIGINVRETSQFYIDDNEVKLTNTISKILDHVISSGEHFDQDMVDERLQNLSEEHFNSSLITDLLRDIYYKVEGDFDLGQGMIRFSAAYDREHFNQTEELPPYLFLSIPTTDLEYFVNHVGLPTIEVKGYDIALQSIEVESGNKLNIKLKEINKNWDINVIASLILRENTIYPEVEQIEASGLDFLTKALFKVFKGILIRQIEKRPIPVRDAYKVVKEDLEKKYPFVQLMSGYFPRMDTLLMGKDITEIMIHFAEEEPTA